MNDINRYPMILAADKGVPESISVRVGEEILNSRFEAGAWAQALAAVHGRREDAVAEYARIRIAHLMAKQALTWVKTESLERRRLVSCLGVKTVKDLLKGINRGGRINLPRPRLPYLWLALLVIGCSGSMAGLLRLVGPGMSEAVQVLAPWIALGAAASLVALFVVLSQWLVPSRLLHWVWGEGVVVACSMACLASLYLGAKVLERNPHNPNSGALAPVVHETTSPLDDERTVSEDVVAPPPSMALQRPASF